MTRSIVALIDGSIYSQSVCAHTAWAARRIDASVELMHVIGRRDDVANRDLSGAVGLGAKSVLMRELAELDEQRAKLTARAGRAMLEEAQGIIAKDGVETITTRLRHGDIVETVAQIEGSADLIVIGKRGEAADFARGHLGSNLERIVRASHKPLLVAARAFRPIAKVLVAYDGGATAMKAVDRIARDPLFAGLAIHLVTVGSETDATRRTLEIAAATLSAGGHEASTAILGGQPETALAEYVTRTGIDLVVMGAYGHTRIRSLIVGSTTTAMIRSCKVPILLVR